MSELVIGDEPEAWRRAGFSVAADGTVAVGSTRLRLVGGDDRGIHSWSLRADGRGDLDGLATSWTGAGSDVIELAPGHENGAIAIDHVVVGTPNRDRTVAAVREVLGLEPRRQTEYELYGRAMVQTFYVLHDLVLEVISRPEAEGDGPATFWGLAFTVSDLDATVARLGDGVSAPREARQPGRRIATLRTDGVSVPVAFLSPRPPERTAR